MKRQIISIIVGVIAVTLVFASAFAKEESVEAEPEAVIWTCDVIVHPPIAEITPDVHPKVEEVVTEEPVEEEPAPVEEYYEPVYYEPVYYEAYEPMSDEEAKEWIAQRESGGDYNAVNPSGRYIGRYQLTADYLDGDYSPEHQEEVADAYVLDRYGSWSAAQEFWSAHGYY